MAHEGEPCLLAFTDGRRAVGVLENFLPQHEILKFQPANSTNPTTVAFSDLLTLQLLNAAQLEVHTLPDGAGLPGRRPPHDGVRRAGAPGRRAGSDAGAGHGPRPDPPGWHPGSGGVR